MIILQSNQEKLELLNAIYKILHLQLVVAENSGDQKKVKALLAAIHNIATKQYRIREQIRESENSTSKVFPLENQIDMVIHF